MRIVRWAEDPTAGPRFGLWINDMIADGGTAEELGLPPGAGVEALLAQGMSALVAFETRAVTQTRRARSEVRLLPPLVRPSKIFAVGLNYREHVEEQGLDPPAFPRIFLKPPSAIVGPEDDIVIPDFCDTVDPEVELAFVIGKQARRVPAARASSVIAGYLIVNDVTDRKIQKQDVQYTRGKGLDTFCPLGPALVTKDEVPDPQKLSIRLFVDGELRQDSTTANLIHGIGALVEFISAGITLEPGDIVSTGTPSGVGVFREPKLFLRSGETVRCEIERIGAMENRVIAAGE